MDIELREFNLMDFDKIITLWRNCEGIGLSAADEPERIRMYLERNPGCSFTAWDGADLVGAVLCGHDGRRGYLHHLAVDQAYRRRGIGKMLMKKCLDAIQAQGIDKVHIFVYRDNEKAARFWQRNGWYKRDDLALMSIDINVGRNIETNQKVG